MTTIFRRVLGAVAVMGASACVASASSISYYVDIFSGATIGALCPGGSPGVAGICPTSTSATPNNGSSSTVQLTLPQFNQLGNVDEGTPTPGNMFVLTSVKLALDWSLTGTASALNSAYSPSMTPVAVSFTNVQAQADMTLNAGGTQVVGQGTAGTGPGTIPYNNAINGVPVPPFGLYYLGSYTSAPLGNSGANSQFAANIAYFEGFGANTFLASVTTNAVTATGTSTDPNAGTLTPFGTPRVTYGGSGQMAGIMTITYDYTEQAAAAPEPGTLVLMGGALIGLGCITRRKRMSR